MHTQEMNNNIIIIITPLDYIQRLINTVNKTHVIGLISQKTDITLASSPGPLVHIARRVWVTAACACANCTMKPGIYLVLRISLQKRGA